MASPKVSESMNKEDSQMSREIIGICDRYTAEEEKALLRKIDMVILPFVSPDPSVVLTAQQANSVPV